MLVPSVSPAQGHMQVCTAVKAPGAVRGSETLHMYAGHLAGLAPGQNEHVRLDSAKLALCSTPARARFRMHREINRTQGATRNTPQWCDRPGRYSSAYSAMQPAFAEMRACALACPDSLCGRRGLCALLTEPRVPYECWAYCAGRNCPVKRASVLSRSLSASPGAVAGVCFHHAARADQRRPTSTIP